MASAIKVRPVQPEDFNDVRYLHATAFRSQAYTYYAPEELDAFEKLVRAPSYIDRLMSNALLGGWVGTELVATAAWHRPQSNDRVGRISALFVLPLFSRAGIGSYMLQAIEASAEASECSLVSVRAPLNAQLFFYANGYEISGRGTSPLLDTRAIDIVFMRKTIPAKPRMAYSVCVN
ncbi:MAG: GNAT family N-acetyltransferase [Filomicrobium sp.]